MKSNNKAVEEGFDAFLSGVPRSACPYQDWSLEFFQWLVGWEQAEEIKFAVVKSPRRAAAR